MDIIVKNQISFAMNFDYLLHLPVNIFWKNLDGVYLGCNDLMAKSISLSSNKEIIGRTLCEFFNEKDSKVILKNDNLVTTFEEAVTVVEVKTDQEEHKFFQSSKQPLYNVNGDLVGMFGYSLNFANKKYSDVQKLHRHMTAVLRNSLHASKNKVKLTKREKIIAKMTILGHSANEIADILFISKRTVESHLVNIKAKLAVKKKSELIRSLLANKIITLNDLYNL